MKVNSFNRNSKVNFRANFVDSQLIKKKGEEYPVCIVELCSSYKDMADDIKAIKSLAVNWEKSYVNELLNDYFGEFNNETLSEDKFFNKQHIYAITEQDKNFERMDEKKILGIAEFKEFNEKQYFKLMFLQTNPQYILSKNSNPLFSGIGTAILNFLKKKFFKYPIKLEADDTAIPFYLKNGFVKETPPTSGWVNPFIFKA